MKKIALALAAALAFAALPGAASAQTYFSNDFSAGLGANEAVTGSFAAGNGFVGHQDTYANNEVSTYSFTSAFSGPATLSFNYSLRTENCCDPIGLYILPNATSNSTALGTQVWSLAGGFFDTKPVTGTAAFDVSAYASQATRFLFRFTSDGSVAGAGVQLSAMNLTGPAGAGVGAPGPVAGAGLPFLMVAGAAWLALRRKAA